MALPLAGRKIGIYDMTTSPGVLVAGVTSKSISIGAEMIDITSDDDAGFRKALSTPGVQSLDLSIEGVVKNTTLISRAIGGTALITNYELRIDTIGTIEGNFFLSSVEIGAATAEAITFSASLSSSGSFTYTAI